MDGKIGLEEHFATPETLSDSAAFAPERCWAELSTRLLDVAKERIAVMDAHGMEMMIVSLNAPTVQGIAEVSRAAEVARRAWRRCRCRTLSWRRASSSVASGSSISAARW